MTRKLLRPAAALLGLLLALALAAPARAGGWSVVVLDSGPLTGAADAGSVIAGQPVAFGFLVLQHGKRPIDGLAPRITATHAGSGEVVATTASPGDRPGHYRAELTLPAPGVWEWQIEAFGPIATMAPINVLAAAPAPAPAAPAALPAALPWAGLILAGLGAAFVIARARRPAVA